MPAQVERALISRFGDRRILLTTKDGRLVCIAPGDQDEVLAFFAKQAYAATDGGQVAIGRPQPGAGGVVQSYEEALNALDLADRLDLDEPVLRAADLLVYPGADPRPAGHGRPGAQHTGAAAAGPRRGAAAPRHPHRLLRLGLRRGRGGPPAVAERACLHLPPGPHPQAHRAPTPPTPSTATPCRPR